MVTVTSVRCATSCLAQQFDNAIQEVGSRSNRRTRMVRRNLGIRARFVIGHRFQVIGLSEKRREFLVDARLASREAVKLPLDYFVGLG